MQAIMEKKESARVAQRIAIEAAITCRPFTSCWGADSAEAVMRNFSKTGCYIETSGEFKPGTILHVRMLRYPPMPPAAADKTQPRSICLAEVKWQQEVAVDNAIRFGMGLRYLE